MLAMLKNGNVHGPATLFYVGRTLHYFEAHRDVRHEENNSNQNSTSGEVCGTRPFRVSSLLNSQLDSERTGMCRYEATPKKCLNKNIHIP